MWETIIPAVISAAGSFLGGERANEQSAEVAREQMAFQERMSSTAHQREVADLRAAGLNPILSTRLGGSSSPAGAMPNIRDSIGDATRAGVSTALQASQTAATLDNLEAATAKTKVDTALSEAQIKNVEAQTYKTNMEGAREFIAQPFIIPRSQAEVDNLRSSGRMTEQSIRNAVIDELAKKYGLSSAAAAAALGKVDEEFYSSQIGKVLRLGELSSDAINPLVNSAATVSKETYWWSK